jgi:hypothetical protein
MEENKKPTIYDDYLIREKDGRKIKRIHLLFVDHKSEPLLCDCCDKVKQLAHFEDILGNVWCICKDCLQEMINEFD